ELLDDLTDRRFFGEVTFYFQGGNIESNRLSERNTKSEIRDRMQARKCRKVVVSLPRSAGKTV
ncbi:MAG: hypothetical protein LBP60_02695, partial [Spirochaetaceae bacterium]|nr:hypothetical protein [Spirochaetaceae bacterium]